MHCEIKDYLSYDPTTGDLTWIKSSKGTAVGTKVGGRRSKVKNYIRVCVNQTPFMAHIVCWYLHYGSWPTKHLDHIDGNRSNNKIENLREASRQENSRNTSSHKNSSSKFKGISWDKINKKWLCRIKAENKFINLGRFSNEKEAAYIYNIAAEKYFGEFAKLNQIF